MLNTFMTLFKHPSKDCRGTGCQPLVSLAVITCYQLNLSAFLTLFLRLRGVWRLGLVTGCTSQDGHGGKSELRRLLPETLPLLALI